LRDAARGFVAPRGDGGSRSNSTSRGFLGGGIRRTPEFPQLFHAASTT
jgi:hypothetical protein